MIEDFNNPGSLDESKFYPIGPGINIVCREGQAFFQQYQNGVRNSEYKVLDMDTPPTMALLVRCFAPHYQPAIGMEILVRNKGGLFECSITRVTRTSILCVLDGSAKNCAFSSHGNDWFYKHFDSIDHAGGHADSTIASARDDGEGEKDDPSDGDDLSQRSAIQWVMMCLSKKTGKKATKAEILEYVTVEDHRRKVERILCDGLRKQQGYFEFNGDYFTFTLNGTKHGLENGWLTNNKKRTREEGSAVDASQSSGSNGAQEDAVATAAGTTVVLGGVANNAVVADTATQAVTVIEAVAVDLSSDTTLALTADAATGNDTLDSASIQPHHTDGTADFAVGGGDVTPDTGDRPPVIAPSSAGAGVNVPTSSGAGASAVEPNNVSLERLGTITDETPMDSMLSLAADLVSSGNDVVKQHINRLSSEIDVFDERAMQGFATHAKSLGKLMIILKKTVNEAYAARDILRADIAGIGANVLC